MDKLSDKVLLINRDLLDKREWGWGGGWGIRMRIVIRFAHLMTALLGPLSRAL